jgi:hypothetical protein
VAVRGLALLEVSLLALAPFFALLSHLRKKKEEKIIKRLRE